MRKKQREHNFFFNINAMDKETEYINFNEINFKVGTHENHFSKLLLFIIVLDKYKIFQTYKQFKKMNAPLFHIKFEFKLLSI